LLFIIVTALASPFGWRTRARSVFLSLATRSSSVWEKPPAISGRRIWKGRKGDDGQTPRGHRLNDLVFLLLAVTALPFNNPDRSRKRRSMKLAWMDHQCMWLRLSSENGTLQAQRISDVKARLTRWAVSKPAEIGSVGTTIDRMAEWRMSERCQPWWISAILISFCAFFGWVAQTSLTAPFNPDVASHLIIPAYFLGVYLTLAALLDSHFVVITPQGVSTRYGPVPGGLQRNNRSGADCVLLRVAQRRRFRRQCHRR